MLNLRFSKTCMRVLIVNTYHYVRGGDCRHVFGLEKLLKRNRCDVHHFAMKGNRNLPCADDPYFVEEIDYADLLGNGKYLESLRVLWKSIYSLEAKANIARLVHKVKPDVVHMHSVRHHITCSIISELTKRRIPIVWTLHDYKELCPNTTFRNAGGICEQCRGKRYFKTVLNRCKKESLAASMVTFLEAKVNSFLDYDRHIGLYISPSAFLREKFIEYGYSPDRIIHLPNFMDVDQFTPHYEYSDYMLFLGRLERSKGLGTLIEAFARMKEEGSSLRLKIAGTGNMERALSFAISRRDLANIDMLGLLQGDALMEAIRNAMAIVVPSEWYENYPFSILEAMAFGKPVIASRIGGIPEQVEDGITGYLFEPFSASNLAEKIKLLSMQSKEEITRMGMAAREKVERVNSPDSYLRSIMKIYKSLLPSGRDSNTNGAT